MKGYENRIAINETLQTLKIRVENIVIASIADVHLSPLFEVIALQTKAVILLKEGIRNGLKWSKDHLHFEKTEIAEMWKKFIG